MEPVLDWLSSYGYYLLFGVGFAEFAGAPIAATPVLLAAGAVAASGSLELPLAVLSAALGGWLADAVWFELARRKGRRLLGAMCGLTSNPAACVLKVVQKLERIGPLYILPAKFLPGTANLIAPSAGLAGVATATFLVSDLVALLAWGTVYTGLGYLFAPQIDQVFEVVTAFWQILLIAIIALVAAAAVWRVYRARMHGSHHRSSPWSAS